jgi:hypothetical protein
MLPSHEDEAWTFQGHPSFGAVVNGVSIPLRIPVQAGIIRREPFEHLTFMHEFDWYESKLDEDIVFKLVKSILKSNI